MKNVLLVGGGKIGVAITEFLSGCGDYRLTVADRDAASLALLPEKNVSRQKVEIGDAASFANVVDGHDIVLSATPYHLTATVAEAAKRAHAHYLASFRSFSDIQEQRPARLVQLESARDPLADARGSDHGR